MSWPFLATIVWRGLPWGRHRMRVQNTSLRPRENWTMTRSGHCETSTSTSSRQCDKVEWSDLKVLVIRGAMELKELRNFEDQDMASKPSNCETSSFIQGGWFREWRPNESVLRELRREMTSSSLEWRKL